MNTSINPATDAMRTGDMLGAVLTGGQSRRMGRDKALLQFGGELLWRRQARVLREAGVSDVLLVRRPGQTVLDPAVTHLRDSYVEVGPIAGLHATLLATTKPWVAVLAVDLPRIEAGWFERLKALCRRGCGAVAHHADGYEPLAAIYPREALAPVIEQLHARHYSLQKLVAWLVRADRMAVVALTPAERAAVENWNTPESVDAGVLENDRDARGRT